MSGFGTKKKGGDAAVELTFPAVFSEAYASRHIPLRFAPSVMYGEGIPAGSDFQAMVHQQRQADAHRMVKAKVDATRNARTRAFSSHAGYFGMPDEVLGQRVYANPSGGAEMIHSARQDGSVPAPFQLVESGLSGGVLRSAEGQAYGKALLRNRVGQLDQIEAAKQIFKTTGSVAAVPDQPASSFAEPLGDSELQLALQGILNATMVGDYKTLSSNTFLADGIRMLSMLVRWAVATEDPEDYEDKLAIVQNIYENLEALSDPDRVTQVVGESADTGQGYAEVMDTMKNLFELIQEYLQQMMEFSSDATRTPKERQQKSRALIKDLGFRRFYVPLKPAGQEAPRRVLDVPTEEDYDDGPSDGRWTRTASTREDSEAASRSIGRFDADERQQFGRDSGAFFGESVAEESGPDPYERAVPEAEVAEEEAIQFPRSRDELPRDREGFDALARLINSLPEEQRPTLDKKPIRVYSFGKAANIRKTFIKRLGL